MEYLGVHILHRYIFRNLRNTTNSSGTSCLHHKKAYLYNHGMYINIAYSRIRDWYDTTLSRVLICHIIIWPDYISIGKYTFLMAGICQLFMQSRKCPGEICFLGPFFLIILMLEKHTNNNNNM